MCGRFTLRAPAQAVEQLFPLFELADVPPRYNIAPTQPVLAVRAGAEGKPEPVRLRWGLVPSWAADPSIGNRLINARSETVAGKPAFRSAFRQRRCLVLADGFYEWQQAGRQRQPFLFRLHKDRPFAFAGLWECWKKGESPLETCTLLTTNANELLGTIHIRMPVILPHEVYDRWLDPALKDPEALQALLLPYPAQEMEGYPVATWVNNARHEGAECIVPKA
jgi:putative SOS response-associated peptidase YedK